ncbi:MAG: type II toxin-antitoxin system RelE/ParE family toxin [Adlercreutzia sp.]|nr:type II toxin-antitoxin system RelE/ParE family toxin [Adlercreutzia sp.]
MAYKKVILKSAQAEYRDIVSYLVEVLKSPQAAIHFMNEFDYQLDLIVETPEMFSLSRMPELAARGYRAAHVNNYLMLYKIQDQNVVVAHIFHQSQDYARLV